MKTYEQELADNRIKNREYARRERDRLRQQRKAAAERKMGIRRCRRGHIIDGAAGERYCLRCHNGKPKPVSENELVEQILLLDDEREKAPSHEWPRYRAMIARLRDQIDELARARQTRYSH